MSKIIKVVIFAVISIVFIQVAGAEESVRLSWKINEDLVVAKNGHSVEVLLENANITTDAIVLPYLETICSKGKSIIPLNTGGEGLENMIISDGQVQLFFNNASWCDSEPRDPVGLTVILFISPAENIISMN